MLSSYIFNLIQKEWQHLGLGYNRSITHCVSINTWNDSFLLVNNSSIFWDNSVISVQCRTEKRSLVDTQTIQIFNLHLWMKSLYRTAKGTLLPTWGKTDPSMWPLVPLENTLIPALAERSSPCYSHYFHKKRESRTLSPAQSTEVSVHTLQGTRSTPWAKSTPVTTRKDSTACPCAVVWQMLWNFIMLL